jgi:hypothetical protein
VISKKRFYHKYWGQVHRLTPFLKKVERRDKILYHYYNTPTEREGSVTMLNQDYTTKLLNLEDVIITNVENIGSEVHIHLELPRKAHKNAARASAPTALF